MNGNHAVLPMIWAYAENSVAAANVEMRKGPASLRLVQASAEPMAAVLPVQKPAPAPELAFYRKYTEAMLRRYQKLSMEAGRVPSMLGRELFRGKVTNYKVSGFDDVVIFTHDMAVCVAKLDKGQQYLIRRIGLQEYTQGETAAMLGLSLRSVVRRYRDAVDELTAMLLAKAC